MRNLERGLQSTPEVIRLDRTFHHSKIKGSQKEWAETDLWI